MHLTAFDRNASTTHLTAFDFLFVLYISKPLNAAWGFIWLIFFFSLPLSLSLKEQREGGREKREKCPVLTQKMNTVLPHVS